MTDAEESLGGQISIQEKAKRHHLQEANPKHKGARH